MPRHCTGAILCPCWSYSRRRARILKVFALSYIDFASKGLGVVHGNALARICALQLLFRASECIRKGIRKGGPPASDASIGKAQKGVPRREGASSLLRTTPRRPERRRACVQSATRGEVRAPGWHGLPLRRCASSFAARAGGGTSLAPPLRTRLPRRTRAPRGTALLCNCLPRVREWRARGTRSYEPTEAGQKPVFSSAAPAPSCPPLSLTRVPHACRASRQRAPGARAMRASRRSAVGGSALPGRVRPGGCPLRSRLPRALRVLLVACGPLAAHAACGTDVADDRARAVDSSNCTAPSGGRSVLTAGGTYSCGGYSSTGRAPLAREPSLYLSIYMYCTVSLAPGQSISLGTCGVEGASCESGSNVGLWIPASSSYYAGSYNMGRLGSSSPPAPTAGTTASTATGAAATSRTLPRRPWTSSSTPGASTTTGAAPRWRTR